jgi:tetratricopeptide (TPR) repeat protein
MSDPLRRFLPAWLRTSVPPPAPPVQSEVDATEATQAYFERRIADAGRLFIDAVKSEEIHGPLNPRLATALNNLAEFYRVQGEFSQAEPYYWRAITIDEQALGPDHVNLARDLNNLALLYRAQGRYADAEPLCQRALEIKDKLVGPEHPSMMTVVGNLLAVYLAQGKYVEAEPLYRRSLSLKAKAFGPDHPNFTTSLANYTALLRKTRGDAEAAKLESAMLSATNGERRERPRMTLVAGRGGR